MYIHVCARLRVPYIIYMRRGLRCCCLDEKAIPEPRLAEQQDCSPAFFIYMYFYILRVFNLEGPLFLHGGTVKNDGRTTVERQSNDGRAMDRRRKCHLSGARPTRNRQQNKITIIN
jgi:hypothetical protein